MRVQNSSCGMTIGEGFGTKQRKKPKSFQFLTVAHPTVVLYTWPGIAVRVAQILSDNVK